MYMMFSMLVNATFSIVDMVIHIVIMDPAGKATFATGVFPTPYTYVPETKEAGVYLVQPALTLVPTAPPSEGV